MKSHVHVSQEIWVLKRDIAHRGYEFDSVSDIYINYQILFGISINEQFIFSCATLGEHYS